MTSATPSIVSSAVMFSCASTRRVWRGSMKKKLRHRTAATAPTTAAIRDTVYEATTTAST